MSHTAPPSSNKRRYELLGGAAFLLVGAIVLVVALIALNQPKGRQAARSTGLPTSQASSSSTPQPSATSPKPSTKPKSTAPSTSSARPAVIVLNNTSEASRVAKAISRLAQAGWSASDGGVFDGSILSTAIYYDPQSLQAQQAAIALQAQFPEIKRVKEKFSGLPQGPLILIVTTDYS